MTSIRPALRSLLPMLLAVFLLPGCSKDTTGPAPADDTVTGTIGAAGGVLATGGGEFTLTVPAGALAAETVLTVRKLAGDDMPDQLAGAAAAYAIEPEGVTFAAPVSVEFEVDAPAKSARVQGLAVLKVFDLLGLNPTLTRNTVVRASLSSWTIRSDEVDRPGIVGAVFLDGIQGRVTVPHETVACNEQFQVTLDFEADNADLAAARVTWSDFSNEIEDNDLVWSATQGNSVVLGEVDATTRELSATWGTYTCRQPPPSGDAFLWGRFVLSEIQTASAAVLPGTTLEIQLQVELECEECVGSGTGEFRGVVSSDLTLPEGLTRIRNGFAGLVVLGFLAFILAGGNGWAVLNGSTGAFLQSLFVVTTVALWGIVPLSHVRADKEGDEVWVDAALSFGPEGASIVHYFPDGDQPGWGWTQFIEFQQPVYDAIRFGQEDATSGCLFVRAGDVNVVTWDATEEFYTGDIGLQLPWTQFPGREDPLISAFSVGPDQPVLVLESGSPGRIWLHDRTGDEAAILGAVGDDPRRVRADGGIAAVSNYGGDSLTLLTWNGGATAAIVGTVTVGAGPVGIDVMALGDGTVGIVSTGFLDDSYTVTVVNAADGAVVSNVTAAAPEGCDAPGHAVWVRDGTRRIAFSCNGGDAVATLDSGL